MRHDLEPPAAPLGRSIFSIINEVGEKHGFTYIEMLSARRFAPLAQARQEAYWRCMKETLCSLPTIGRHFGNRDHTTVLKGARVFEQRLARAKRAGESLQDIGGVALYSAVR